MAEVVITNITQGSEWDNFEAYVKVSNDEEHSGEWSTGYQMTTEDGVTLNMNSKIEDKRTWIFPIEFDSVDDYIVGGEYEGFTLVKYVDKLELVWDGETDPVIPKNLSITYQTIKPLVEPFELPYPNWYDSEGRIYKDILIKNFNAIESKINELLALDISSFTKPDISEVVYPNVSLSDEGKDEQILNLQSFLDIVDLINYPLVVTTDGNIKVTKVAYWGSDYHYHTVINDSVVPDTTDRFIYLDYDNKEIIKSSSVTPPTNCVLVAVLKDGNLITNNINIAGNVNFPSILAEQAYTTQTYTGSGRPNGNEYGLGGARKGGYDYNGQTMFMWTGETNSANTYSGTVNTFGLEKKLKEGGNS